MALGATEQQVLRMIVQSGLVLILAGVGLGSAGAFALTGFMRALLQGISTTDLTTFIVVILSAIAAGGLASYLPARRASRVAPAVALRQV
jgi:ABC-type antimicrobial peptide transport system permease subunit